MNTKINLELLNKMTDFCIGQKIVGIYFKEKTVDGRDIVAMQIKLDSGFSLFCALDKHITESNNEKLYNELVGEK